ncbi:MAG: hypothetical protein EU539_09665, partial [Promethearchaeota archaeon]
MDDIPYLKFKNLYIIPTFHSRLEFTKLVRKAYFMIFPDVICVELPDNIRDEVIEGINRLPYLSLIAYADTLNPTKLNFVPIDPGDSIIEATRTGLDYEIPIEFIDLSVKDYMPPAFKLPDDYSINKLGLKLFYEKVSEYFEEDFWKKKNKLRDKINLEDFIQNQDIDQLNEEEASFQKDILREKYMASHLHRMMPLYNRILFVVGMGHWENIRYFLENPEKIENVDFNLIPHEFVKIYNIKSSDARFLLRELPYNTHKWLKFRKRYSKTKLDIIDTPDELFKILDSYSKKDNVRKILLKSKYLYEEEFKEFVDLHKLKTLFQYTRNLSLTEKRLLPNLTQLLISSKNIVDDDYAWKVFDIATKYPHDDESQ